MQVPNCGLAAVIDANDVSGSLAQLAERCQERASRLRRLSSRDLGGERQVLGYLVVDDPPTAVVEACALAAEAVRRWLGVEMHASQLAGSIAMSCGWTVQMRTGEGKTFAAVGPALLHASASGPVHVITANGYLAERDSRWSGKALGGVGLKVAATLPSMSRQAKRAAYAADVVFGSGVEFGFDYLRDRLFLPGDEPVQRGRRVAIVDEADAVLIDSARTPLILSGAAPPHREALERAEQVVRALRIQVDVLIDGDRAEVELTEEGMSRCEQLLGVDNLYGDDGPGWPHLIHNAMRARAVLRRDRDYLVVDGQVEVVDALTGRVTAGRRWSEGLHQAVEAKEGLEISPERHAVAQITQAGYFSGYDHLVGMSGTLDGVEDELEAAYGTRVIALATNREIRRVDHADAAFASDVEKLEAIADDTIKRSHRGQPVLIGTRSISDTHRFAALLDHRGVAHRVLTAENDAAEAEILADAGRPGAVTVATQMAGRGVDIILGGAIGSAADHARVVDAGGLMVWGLEHHPALRLDLQLRGRAGRQGDPGESRFAVSDGDAVLDCAAAGGSVGARALAGQHRSEELEAILRAEVRRYDATIDNLHRTLYEHRARAADPANTSKLLERAVATAGPRLTAGDLEFAGLQPSRRWRSARRADDSLQQLTDRLIARERRVGRDRFLAAARLILRTLLVAVWPHTLEELESQKALTRAAAFPVIQQWDRAAVAIFERFRADIDRQWLLQAISFKWTTGTAPGPAVDDRAPTRDLQVLPRPSAPATTPGAESAYLGEWHGWSFNRFVRKHFGVDIPDPPVVLVVDSIGDNPTHEGLALTLDLIHPDRTTVSADLSHPGAA